MIVQPVPCTNEWSDPLAVVDSTLTADGQRRLVVEDRHGAHAVRFHVITHDTAEHALTVRLRDMRCELLSYSIWAAQMDVLDPTPVAPIWTCSEVASVDAIDWRRA